MAEEKTFDILKHSLVPQHTVLSEEEKNSLLQKYKIVQSQLPKISSSDPAVKSINAKPGDVVKIIRASPTAGESFYFRAVVKMEKVEK